MRRVLKIATLLPELSKRKRRGMKRLVLVFGAVAIVALALTPLAPAQGRGGPERALQSICESVSGGEWVR